MFFFVVYFLPLLSRDRFFSYTIQNSHHFFPLSAYKMYDQICLDEQFIQFHLFIFLICCCFIERSSEYSIIEYLNYITGNYLNVFCVCSIVQFFLTMLLFVGSFCKGIFSRRKCGAFELNSVKWLA